MLTAYDLYLIPGGEDRSARLLAEADAERRAAAVRRSHPGRWPSWRRRRLFGRSPTAAAGAHRVPVRP
jgi:hypothetical protein